MKRERSASRLMNVKIPAYVGDAIEQLANEVGASKTEVVIALLNEGLAVSESAIKGWREQKTPKGSKR